MESGRGWQCFASSDDATAAVYLATQLFRATLTSGSWSTWDERLQTDQ